MRSAAILLTSVICTGCAAISPADEAVARISYCVTGECLDSLSEIRPSLRLTVSDGNRVIALAADKAPEIFGAALTVAKPPREAAAIFVNMLADGDSAMCANAATIARQAIACYKAMNLCNECDTFVAAVDEQTLRLPIELQAKILTASTPPDRLGRFMSRNNDETVTEAVREAYGTDSLKLNQFNNAFK